MLADRRLAAPSHECLQPHLPVSTHSLGAECFLWSCQVGLALLVVATWFGLQAKCAWLTLRFCLLLYLKNVNGKEGGYGGNLGEGEEGR